MAERGRRATEINETTKQEGRKIREQCREKGQMQISKGHVTDWSLSSLPPVPESFLQNSVWFIRTE